MDDPTPHDQWEPDLDESREQDFAEADQYPQAEIDAYSPRPT